MNSYEIAGGLRREYSHLPNFWICDTISLALKMKEELMKLRLQVNSEVLNSYEIQDRIQNIEMYFKLMGWIDSSKCNPIIFHRDQGKITYFLENVGKSYDEAKGIVDGLFFQIQGVSAYIQ